MGKIDVVSLGWYEDDLTLGIIKKLRSAHKVILRTGRCGAFSWLQSEKIPFETFDSFYDETDDFDELIKMIVDRLNELSDSGDVLYGVCDPGDMTCRALIDSCPDKVILSGGISEGNVLSAYAAGSFRQINALEYADFLPNASIATLVREIDSQIIAGEIKLKLMDAYPEETKVTVLLPDGMLKSMPLCELDWMSAENYDHRTCALIPATEDITEKTRFSFEDLTTIMTKLRSCDGCPWDREQTHKTLRNSMIEEAYEVSGAIDEDDPDALCDELGDVLFHVVFHAEIAKEFSEFDVSDVTTAICHKMIERHPHVFGELHCDSGEETVGIWERAKMSQQGLTKQSDALWGVTKSLPALLRAEKLQRKAKAFGFEDEHKRLDISKLGDFEKNADKEEAIGQTLFDVVRLACSYGVDAELALSKAADRFIHRFEDVEKQALDAKISVEEFLDRQKGK